ncbi:MAG: hydantoinase/oxoprolinase N-terminal domain-containing protein, partial [Candidatus Rokuibacteriota bacterium]
MIVVGIDVGGTFTDIAAVDEETGTVSLAKVPSTPQDEARAVLKGLAELGVAPQPRPWPRQSTRRAVSSGVPTSRLWHPGSAAPGPERGGAMGFDEKVDRGAAVT